LLKPMARTADLPRREGRNRVVDGSSPAASVVSSRPVSDVEHEFVLENQRLRDEAARLQVLVDRAVRAAIAAQDAATGVHDPWLDDALSSVVTPDPSP
jgi:hypothetical protein